MTFKFPFSYELDHIGIAVESIESGGLFYKNLGFADPEIDVVETEGVKVAMYRLGNQANIELLEPTSDSSPIRKFLQKRGPGIHHICLRVEDIRATLELIKKTDIQLLNSEPKPGAHGTQVVFIHPKSAGGVLVELNQIGTEGL